MIQTLVDRFMENKAEIEMRFGAAHPSDYLTLVKTVVEIITSKDDYGECNLDPERIHQIDDGDYQGTLVYVIGEKGYQPSDYWCVKIEYGSCSGCDTLERIQDYSSDPPTEEQVKAYTTLALHVVQGLRSIGEEENVNCGRGSDL